MNSATPTVMVLINGTPVRLPPGCSVAAALALEPPGTCRTSVSGEPRAPLCGMGVCHECRVRIDGRVRLACQTPCTEGLHIDTLCGQPGTAP